VIDGDRGGDDSVDPICVGLCIKSVNNCNIFVFSCCLPHYPTNNKCSCLFHVSNIVFISPSVLLLYQLHCSVVIFSVMNYTYGDIDVVAVFVALRRHCVGKHCAM